MVGEQEIELNVQLTVGGVKTLHGVGNGPIAAAVAAALAMPLRFDHFEKSEAWAVAQMLKH